VSFIVTVGITCAPVCGRITGRLSHWSRGCFPIRMIAAGCSGIRRDGFSALLDEHGVSTLRQMEVIRAIMLKTLCKPPAEMKVLMEDAEAFERAAA